MKNKNFLLVLVIALLAILSSCSNYSEGERVGVITKFSYKGKVELTKSFEGELKIAPSLIQGGMVGQYETFSWSIDNDNTILCETPIDSIKLYASLGIPVIVFYQQVAYLNLLNNRGDTDYFVKSIKRAK